MQKVEKEVLDTWVACSPNDGLEVLLPLEAEESFRNLAGVDFVPSTSDFFLSLEELLPRVAEELLRDLAEVEFVPSTSFFLNLPLISVLSRVFWSSSKSPISFSCSVVRFSKLSENESFSSELFFSVFGDAKSL